MGRTSDQELLRPGPFKALASLSEMFRDPRSATHRAERQRKQGSGIRTLCLKLAFFLVAGLTQAAWAQGTPDSIRLVGTIETDPEELTAPVGLAFSTKAGEFLVMEKPARDLVRLSDTHGAAGRFAFPAAVADPINMAFDELHGRLLFLNRRNNKLIEISAGPDGVPRANKVKQTSVEHFRVSDPQGMAVDPDTGDLYVLDASWPQIVRIRPDPIGGFDSPAVESIDLRANGLDAFTLQGLAFDPTTGHVHVLSPNDARLYEVKKSGVVAANRDTSDLDLRNPQGMVFAPSRDRTDDRSVMNLYIADSGGESVGASDGGIAIITELSLMMTATSVIDSCSVPGTLVRVIDAWRFDPPSPDTSGATYIGPSGTILLSDSEVNEIPSLFTGDNLFEITLDGTLLRTSTTISFSDEPTGLAYDSLNGHLFVSDDTGSRGIYVWDPGPDGLFNTPDDNRTYIDTRKYDPLASDPEGVAFDSARGVLYMADGVNSEVYRIEPGPNGIFDGVPPAGDDVVTNWDTEIFGIRDPEGLTFDIDTGHLYVVGRPRTCLAHVATDGTFIRGIDISSANARKPAGLAYAPGSVDPTQYSVYITERGVDNNDDPTENDGKVYEFSIPALAIGNSPPFVDAGPDQVVIWPNVAYLDGTVSDDGIPGPLTTTWSVTVGPGTVSFGDASAADTTASFSVAGTYALRLTADDGQLTNSDQIIVDVIGSGGETVIDVRVSARSDDAEEDINGVVGITSSDLELILDKTDQTVGMRFSGLNVPRRAVISNAYIQFQVDERTSVATSLTIQGEAVDDASTFVTANRSISTRARTTTAVPWVPPAWNTVGEAGPNQRTPNINAIIQEIVNRPGWASGHSMVIIVTGTGKRTAESYDGDTNGAPLLHIEYTTENTAPDNTAPVAAITSPANGASFPEGESINFMGTANDTEDGTLTTQLSWTSDLDGVIGTGGDFSTAALSVGTHMITASVTDSGGLTGEDAISVIVSAAAFNAFVTSPSGSNGYSTWGGRNSNAHLRVLITIKNGAGAAVSGASVTATLSGPASVASTGTTNSLGQVEVKINNAPSGAYTTVVTSVSGSGIFWDEITPENSFVKQ